MGPTQMQSKLGKLDFGAPPNGGTHLNLPPHDVKYFSKYFVIMMKRHRVGTPFMS